MSSDAMYYPVRVSLEAECSQYTPGAQWIYGGEYYAVPLDVWCPAYIEELGEEDAYLERFYEDAYLAYLNEEEIMDTRHPAVRSILQYFEYRHLPQRLQEVSKPLHDMAHYLGETLPQNAELTTGLRKLLEAKDCFVRAALTDPETNQAPGSVTDSQP